MAIGALLALLAVSSVVFLCAALCAAAGGAEEAPSAAAAGRRLNDTASTTPPALQKTEEGVEQKGPGVEKWALASALLAILASGLVRVYRVLNGLDVTSTAMRNVPEGMRPAECGACHTLQYISTHGRIFICFCCHSANRTPRDLPRGEQQLLVTPTGPLRSYEFRKGGDNYWQELRQEELPSPPAEAEAARAEPQKLHYRGTFCFACGKDACLRLEEFPAEASVAYFPEPSPPLPTPAGAGDALQQQQQPPPQQQSNAPEAEADTAVRPVVVGRQTDGADDEVRSNRSNRSKSTVDNNGLSQCVVCLDQPGCMVLLPCAHGSVCEECATRIAQNRASGGAHCPHCRAGIETLVKLHQVAGDVARGLELRIPMARPL